MRSLRGRLTLGVLLVLAAVLVAAGAAAFREVDALRARGARRPPQAHRRADAADRRGRRPEGAAGRRPRGWTPSCAATGSSLRLRLGRVTLVDAGAAPAAVRRALPRGPVDVRQRRAPLRAYVTTLSDPDLGGLARLEVISPLRGLERRAGQLERRVALIGLRRAAGRGLGGMAGRVGAAAPAAPAARGDGEHRRRRGPRPPRARRRRAVGAARRSPRSSTRCSRGWAARPAIASARWRRRGASRPTPVTSCARR